MDSRALSSRLEGEAHAPSRRYRQLLQGAPFLDRTRTDHQSAQECVERWCRWFAEQGLGKLGLPPSRGGNPLHFNCLGYELGLFDFSLMMRFGLQYGFVMRAICRLGDENQQHWLEPLANMTLPACFAMTERAHGSNVKGLQTRAEYLPGQDRFKLSTPHPGATKEYVAALQQAHLAVVFARLVVGDKDKGVHAFVVPLRDSQGGWRTGVTVQPGKAMGALNGLDYGSLSFQDLLLPRDHLLARHAELDDSQRYVCKLRSQSRRFNALMGTLVAGRSLIASGAAAGVKSALTIALKYASQRRQFGPSRNQLERTVLSYQAVQRRLMPALATLLAVEAGRTRLVQSQHEYLDSRKERELETFTAAFKSYTSRFAVSTAQHCREVCGGAGAMEASRLPRLRAELDLFTTMEGDNTVLDLMVARNLILDHQRGLSGKRVLKALSWVGQSVTRVTKTGPLKSRDASSQFLSSTEYLSATLRFRRDSLRHSLGRRVRARLNDGFHLFDALNDCQSHGLALASAHCEEKIFRCLRNLTESCPPGWDRRVLEHALKLFALSRVEEHRGWFLEKGYLNSKQSEAIRKEVLELSSVLAQECTDILDAFELPNSLLRSQLLHSEESN